MPYPAVQNSYLIILDILDNLSSLPTSELIDKLCGEALRASTLDQRTEEAFLRIAEIARELEKDGSWGAYQALPEALADLKAKVAVLARVDHGPNARRIDRVGRSSCRSLPVIASHAPAALDAVALMSNAGIEAMCGRFLPPVRLIPKLLPAVLWIAGLFWVERAAVR